MHTPDDDSHRMRHARSRTGFTPGKPSNTEQAGYFPVVKTDYRNMTIDRGSGQVFGETCVALNACGGLLRGVTSSRESADIPMAPGTYLGRHGPR